MSIEWIIYFISVISSSSEISEFTFIFSFLIFSIYSVAHCMKRNMDEDEVDELFYKKTKKLFLTICIVTIPLCIVLPNKKDMYAMLCANYLNNNFSMTEFREIMKEAGILIDRDKN